MASAAESMASIKADATAMTNSPCSISREIGAALLHIHNILERIDRRAAAVRLQAATHGFLARRQAQVLRVTRKKEHELTAAAIRLQAAAHGFLARRQAWTTRAQSSPAARAQASPIAVCFIRAPLSFGVEPSSDSTRFLREGLTPGETGPLLPCSMRRSAAPLRESALLLMVVRRAEVDGVAVSRRRPSRARLRWPPRGIFPGQGASGLHSSRGGRPAAQGTARFAAEAVVANSIGRIRLWLVRMYVPGELCGLLSCCLPKASAHVQIVTGLFLWDPGGEVDMQLGFGLPFFVLVYYLGIIMPRCKRFLACFDFRLGDRLVLDRVFIIVQLADELLKKEGVVSWAVRLDWARPIRVNDKIK